MPCELLLQSSGARRVVRRHVRCGIDFRSAYRARAHDRTTPRSGRQESRHERGVRKARFRRHNDRAAPVVQRTCVRCCGTGRHHASAATESSARPAPSEPASGSPIAAATARQDDAVRLNRADAPRPQHWNTMLHGRASLGNEIGRRRNNRARAAASSDRVGRLRK